MQALDQIRQVSPGLPQRGVPGILDVGYHDLDAALLEALLRAPAHTAGDQRLVVAQAMAYLCPMCRRILSADAEGMGMANYHIIELARMSLGELAAP